MARKRAPAKNARRAKQASSLLAAEHWYQQKEIWGLILITVGVITVTSLATQNQGKLSNAWSLLLRQVFGVGAYPMAALLVIGGILLLLYNSLDAALQKRLSPRWQLIVGCELIFFAGLGLLHSTADVSSQILAMEGKRGGFVGLAISGIIIALVGRTICVLILSALVLGGIYLALNIPWRVLFWRIQWLAAQAGSWVRDVIEQRRARSVVPVERPRPRTDPGRRHEPSASRARPKAKARATATKKRVAPSRDNVARRRRTRSGLPNLDLLVADEADSEDESDARQRAQIIEETLEAFGIPAEVVEWNRGPVVTQFGVEPGYVERVDREGNERRYKVRVSKILSLINDLALALAAAPIRIEAPVPGRPVVGIEVPNDTKTMVGLRGVLESPQFRKKNMQLRIALGRDVTGEAVVADLVAMPHLLIAGATGSGKSVCLNAVIASLLFQNGPDQLNFLMVDPKRVELTKYNGIPQLISPVVVDVPKVIVALRWLTREMDQRYRQFAKAGARDLRSFNSKAKSKGQETLPLIVVIVDELADLMLAAPDDVEALICRLAQMARATGIHLIIATQRPSVDVVTGLIKANFPARISFAVTSQIDSRVILDTPGAEKLLGRGDMLFMAPDSPKLQRIQGCFVSDKEIDDLVAFWRGQTQEEPEPEPPPWEGMSLEPDADDKVLQQAIELIRDRGQASASFLQRHLRIGYPRAARLIDQLEQMGVVGPAEIGGRSRSVLAVGRESAEGLTEEPPEEPLA